MDTVQSFHLSWSPVWTLEPTVTGRGPADGPTRGPTQHEETPRLDEDWASENSRRRHGCPGLSCPLSIPTIEDSGSQFGSEDMGFRLVMQGSPRTRDRWWKTSPRTRTETGKFRIGTRRLGVGYDRDYRSSHWDWNEKLNRSVVGRGWGGITGALVGVMLGTYVSPGPGREG